jgi:hypothetical protein
MTNYIRDLTRVVLLSNDALQTDIQRVQILQKVKTKDLVIEKLMMCFISKCRNMDR